MPDLIMEGKYFHTCCTHVLKLIVKDGLKDFDNSILRIRGAVRYIQSPAMRNSNLVLIHKMLNIRVLLT
jgi:hypothetical protein